ncbi:MAG TPA: copper chaperone PCu(A)C [Lichenihabitans sp.]|jgi:hypothetical protein|nr:copper chaperone PCu(A)C [Lichenihabitans sp.]
MTLSFEPPRPGRPLSLFIIAVALTAAPALARDFTGGAITVEQPWSRATPGNSKVAIGYLTIRNASDTPDRLTAITSDIAGRALPHTMAMKDGVMQMRPVTAGLAVPAHGAVTLKPGADHLMFEDLKHPLTKGGTFPATLTFEKAGAVPVEFTIEGIGARAPASTTGN